MLRHSIPPLPCFLCFLCLCWGCAASSRHAVPPADTRLVFAAPDARSVAVAGSFNRWDPGVNPLVRTGPDGLWTISLRLPPGRHEYLFIIDGARWIPDPGAPQSDDGLGGRNSVLMVPAGEP